VSGGRIIRADVDAVREQSRIDEIVGEHVTLRSAGVGSMKGLCPFHDERTPSFHVRPQLGLWHCFGCGEGGDIISFVQKMDHLPFVEAVEYLAGRIGLQLRYEEGSAPRTGEEPGRRQRLFQAHKIAAEFYSEQLASPEAEIGRRFLMDRGFDRAAADHFGVGYAPRGWDNLLKHLRNKGFTEPELAASGLVSQGRSGHYDRFRGRLMWPIRDLTGDVVGFGARKVHDDDEGPKYLNTPETPIYKKSQVLYGVHLAKREIARNRQVVVVEGYTDVMAAHLAGVQTAVATCGTAFGADHVRVVRRLVGDSAPGAGVQLSSGLSVGGEVIFTFDGDEAGRKAALRAYGEDQRFMAQTFIAISPAGMDPCDLRQQRGDEAVRDLIKSRQPLFQFVLRSTLENFDLDTAEGRVNGLRAAAPVVAGIRDTALRPEYARMLAGWLGMDIETVRRAVHAAGRDLGRRPASSGSSRAASEGPGGAGVSRGGFQRPPADDRVANLERQVLEVVLQLPQFLDIDEFDALPADSFSVSAYRAVHDGIRAAGGLHTARELGVGQQEAGIKRWADAVRQAAPSVIENLITELAVSPLPEDRPDALANYATGVLRALLEVDITRQMADLRSKLQRTSAEGEEHRSAQRQLLELEVRRRSLREE